MYLSFVKYRYLLDNARGLGNCDLMHKDVQALFRSERAADKVLYKAMDDGIIIQSTNPPQSDASTKLKIADQANIDYSVVQKHDVYAFSMRVYPAMKHQNQRFRITDEQEQAKWIQSKSGENGFRILTYSLDPSPKITYRKKNNYCNFVGVDCNGVLMVEDREKFILAMENGIGQEKAYGFGLLMLKGKQNAYGY